MKVWQLGLSISLMIQVSCADCGEGDKADPTKKTSNPDAGNTTAGQYDWSGELIQLDVAPLDASPFALTAGPENRLALVYYASPDPQTTYDCNGVPADNVELRLARLANGSWTSQLLETVRSAQEIAAVFDNQTLHLAYVSGGPTGSVCSASELWYRQVTDSNIGSAVQLAAGSNTNVTCRGLSDICVQGDMVGFASSMALLPNGRMVIAFRDRHFGFSHDDNISSDLEVMIGSTPLASGDRRCLDDSSGSGVFNIAMSTANGTAAVATWVNTGHEFDSNFATGCLDQPPAGTYSWPRGIRLFTEDQAGGTWTSHLVAAVDLAHPFAATQVPQLGYVFIYPGAGGQLTAKIGDGDTYRDEVVDAFRDSVSPVALLDNEDRPMVAYGRCPASSSSCQQVRLATRVDGNWSSEVVSRDSELIHRIEIKLVLDPTTGEPIVAYRDASARGIFLFRGATR